MTEIIQHIAVCGAGTMGSGIVQVCATAGYNCVLFDLNESMLEKGRNQVTSGLEALVKREKMDVEGMNLAVQRIRYSTDINDCVAGLIIEAIVEKLDVKVELFQKLAVINGSDTIFASNTSSLPVSELQKQLVSPERVAGMHFFNPAPVMKLVEVVKGDFTSDETMSIICQVAKKLGKTPVCCSDAPGFIVNRVARPYYLEAMKLVEEGVADIETIDEIMQSAGFRMGPFRLMDLIGIDINYAVSKIVWEALGQPERLQPAALQAEKVAAGELGIKSGKGFYQHQTTG